MADVACVEVTSNGRIKESTCKGTRSQGARNEFR